MHDLRTGTKPFCSDKMGNKLPDCYLGLSSSGPQGNTTFFILDCGETIHLIFKQPLVNPLPVYFLCVASDLRPWGIMGNEVCGKTNCGQTKEKPMGNQKTRGSCNKSH